MSRQPFEPPLLVFPDRSGGFFIFHSPQSVWKGAELAAAENEARLRHGWLAGGLEYGPAETPGVGWWGVFSDPLRVSPSELRAFADPGPIVVGPLASPVSYEDYQRSFEQARQALTQGKSYQVNLTFPVAGLAVSGGPWSWKAALRLWLELIETQGREASFAVLGTASEPGPAIVSASPELFFCQDGVVVEARPMKGTGVRHADPGLDAAAREELATSAKTRAENLMITDMLRNDLGRAAAPGGVSVPRLFDIEEYPTVWQMTSTVRAQFAAEPSLSTLMGVLFPCASITGAPKLSTQEVIAAAEAHLRGWYTGTLGWHRPSRPDGTPAASRFSVLIRTLVFDREDQSHFRLGVGGGVVWDSTARGEWDEAWAKARFLRTVQRDFSLTEAVLWSADEGATLVPEHEARLSKACLAFGGQLAEGALAAAVEQEDQRLRAQGITSPQKLRVLVDPEFRLTVASEPLVPLPATLTLALASKPLGAESLLWRRFKTTNRVVYDQAKFAGVDQTLHYNEQGELTETTSMNLVIEKNGRFLTPSLSGGLLAGTLRARLLAEGRLSEAVLVVDDLKTADQLWLINSVRGWKKAVLVET